MSTFKGVMKDAVPVWREGHPKVSGVYVCACFEEKGRDVLSRMTVPDSHTTIDGEVGTRVSDNLYMFDATAKARGENPWQHISGFYDGGVTHYLDFDVTY